MPRNFVFSPPRLWGTGIPSPVWVVSSHLSGRFSLASAGLLPRTHWPDVWGCPAALSSPVLCPRASGHLGLPRLCAPVLSQAAAGPARTPVPCPGDPPVLGRASLVSHLLGIVLCFLMFRFMKPLFHVFCLDFWLPRWAGKSGPC